MQIGGNTIIRLRKGPSSRRKQTFKGMVGDKLDERIVKERARKSIK
jgi:hypothetical protein